MNGAQLARLKHEALVSRTLAAGLTWAAAHMYDTHPSAVLERRTYDHRRPSLVNGRTEAERDRAARWTVAYVLYEAGASWSSIARALGMDHTSVRHAVHHMPPEWEAAAQPLVDQFARTGRIAS